MTTNRLATTSEQSQFYNELVSRNRHFVGKNTQAAIHDIKVLIAGCGAAGGACIEPLARLGVTRFRLADNGAYELANLNRQHTFIDHIGSNKAEFHMAELLRINPYIDVKHFPEGISEANSPALVEWADLIVDGVDVTTADAIRLKFGLHVLAHKNRKPVLSPLDPGFCQMGYGFDYRKSSTPILRNRLEKCLKAKHPIKALLAMFPTEELPSHSLPLILDLLENPGMPASQLACSADILSGIAGAALIRFIETGELIESWNIDLSYIAHSKRERLRNWMGRRKFITKINRLLRNIE